MAGNKYSVGFEVVPATGKTPAKKYHQGCWTAVEFAPSNWFVYTKANGTTNGMGIYDSLAKAQKAIAVLIELGVTIPDRILTSDEVFELAEFHSQLDDHINSGGEKPVWTK